VLKKYELFGNKLVDPKPETTLTTVNTESVGCPAPPDLGKSGIQKKSNNSSPKSKLEILGSNLLRNQTMTFPF
jgi:hypothetical protein